MSIQAAHHKMAGLLNEAPAILNSISDKDASVRRAPGKWSKKEELGHLIDSAANNHQRFVRLQIDNSLVLLKYKQDEWIEVQHYNELSWNDVIHLWEIYNRHLLHVIKHINPATLRSTGHFGDNKPVTLQYLVDDYVEHMKHHLGTIFGEPYPYHS